MWTPTRITVTRSPDKARVEGAEINLGLLFAKVVIEFTDDNGVASHTYIEARVSDTSPEGLARLLRDQWAQLDRMDAAIADGPPALAELIALARPEPPKATDPDPGAATAANVALLQQRIRHLKAIELGILAPDDAEVVTCKADLDAAVAADRAAVLGLIG